MVYSRSAQRYFEDEDDELLLGEAKTNFRIGSLLAASLIWSAAPMNDDDDASFFDGGGGTRNVNFSEPFVTLPS